MSDESMIPNGHERFEERELIDRGSLGSIPFLVELLTKMQVAMEAGGEECATDKSLAIAHDLEHLYVEPEPASKKTRGRKKDTGSSE